MNPNRFQQFFCFLPFQSHSESPHMPRQEKHSFHSQDKGEMSAVEEEIKTSRLKKYLLSLTSPNNQIIPGTISCGKKQCDLD